MKRQIDIEKLLQWTYCEELTKGGSEIYGQNWLRMGSLAEIGTMVDESHTIRLPPIFGEPHPDALMTARYVDRMPHRANVLVIIHAWKGTRPQPIREPPSVFPVRDGSRVRIFNGRSLGRLRYTEGAFCMLEFVPTPKAIDETRRDWTLWRTALVWLVAVLADKLTDNLPTGPHCPERLW